MSISYQGIVWDGRKKKYDLLILAFSLCYLTLFAVISLLLDPHESIRTLALRGTATLALLMLHVVLSIGPLTRLNKKFLPMLYNRRHLGVALFCIAAVHGSMVLFRIHTQSHINPLVPMFHQVVQFFSGTGTAVPNEGPVLPPGSWWRFPFRPVGLSALTLLLLLAATSHDFWQQTFSPRIWKALHMLVYLAYALVVTHVLLGIFQDKLNPAFLTLLLGGFLWLAGLHLTAGFRERRADQRKALLNSQGFARVCNTSDIEEGRARLVNTGGERIAVFRTEGRLFAVNNVCRHQQGPLGEGKIVDGCITCPWHGHQYLPASGRAPMPFKEKIATYEVKIEAGEVWVNPIPNPEGTEQEGTKI
jgi:methionine sulfoxide reductase heme-binding subunit